MLNKWRNKSYQKYNYAQPKTPTFSYSSIKPFSNTKMKNQDKQKSRNIFKKINKPYKKYLTGPLKLKNNKIQNNKIHYSKPKIKRNTKRRAKTKWHSTSNWFKIESQKQLKNPQLASLSKTWWMEKPSEFSNYKLTQNIKQIG